MGPTLNNLNNLLRLPFGCGEQNLANFAPNIYVLKYLQTTKQLTNDVREKAMYYLRTGENRFIIKQICTDSLCVLFKSFSMPAVLFWHAY